MKTTIELPDDLFREAKATAARRGIALKEFVREAIEEKLSRPERARTGKRPLGVDNGKVFIHDDWDDPIPELDELT